MVDRSFVLKQTVQIVLKNWNRKKNRWKHDMKMCVTSGIELILQLLRLIRTHNIILESGSELEHAEVDFIISDSV